MWNFTAVVHQTCSNSAIIIHNNCNGIRLSKSSYQPDICLYTLFMGVISRMLAADDLSDYFNAKIWSINKQHVSEDGTQVLSLPLPLLRASSLGPLSCFHAWKTSLHFGNLHVESQPCWRLTVTYGCIWITQHIVKFVPCPSFPIKKYTSGNKCCK